MISEIQLKTVRITPGGIEGEDLDAGIPQGGDNDFGSRLPISSYSKWQRIRALARSTSLSRSSRPTESFWMM
ncbi:hypothetical protein N9C66_04025 [Akkermansiaceae bacterium]|nr:hypothetical protein [Akkermansiaceae bacterium]MDA9830484.1 hypothetical protein [Akkermansiaceae bacterium]